MHSRAQAASNGGNEVIVKLLLGNGVEVEAEGGEYGNTLKAMRYGTQRVRTKF